MELPEAERRLVRHAAVLEHDAWTRALVQLCEAVNEVVPEPGVLSTSTDAAEAIDGGGLCAARRSIYTVGWRLTAQCSMANEAPRETLGSSEP